MRFDVFSETLFPPPESLSTKLAWLKKHDIEIREEPLPRNPMYGPKNAKPIVCCDAQRRICGFGESEEEAILDWCAMTEITHYTLEQMPAKSVDVEF